MEGFKSLRSAVLSVMTVTSNWKGSLTGDVFQLNELLNMGNLYDETYEPDGWNYFVSFPTGEIGILSTDDNQIVMLFVPDSGAPNERSNFCEMCGSHLKRPGKFCPYCGAKLE